MSDQPSAIYVSEAEISIRERKTVLWMKERKKTFLIFFVIFFGGFFEDLEENNCNRVQRFLLEGKSFKF